MTDKKQAEKQSADIEEKEEINSPVDHNENSEQSEETSTESGDTVSLGSAEETVEKLLMEKQQMHEKLLRLIAEFENYKKRRASDLTTITATATEDIILDLLPVLDDLNLLVKNANSAKDSDSLVQGASMISQKFADMLKRRGVKEIEAEGKPFDPELHEALLQLPSADVEPDTVLEVHQKGYTLGKKLLRASRVIISAAPEA